MLTTIGKELRKIRIDRGMLLKQMADAIGISSSYLSSIECGKRDIPLDFVKKISTGVRLTDIEIVKLKKAASDKTYIIKAPSEPHQRIAAGLARSFGKLTDEQLDKIQCLLEEGIENE
jgi:transcriptional regulator with XRE-family HTH domain